jgi:hypothetical protein
MYVCLPLSTFHQLISFLYAIKLLVLELCLFHVRRLRHKSTAIVQNETQQVLAKIQVAMCFSTAPRRCMEE